MYENSIFCFILFAIQFLMIWFFGCQRRSVSLQYYISTVMWWMRYSYREMLPWPAGLVRAGLLHQRRIDTVNLSWLLVKCNLLGNGFTRPTYNILALSSGRQSLCEVCRTLSMSWNYIISEGVGTHNMLSE